MNNIYIEIQVQGLEPKTDDAIYVVNAASPIDQRGEHTDEFYKMVTLELV